MIIGYGFNNFKSMVIPSRSAAKCGLAGVFKA
jgi:hypothetical protein